jgi:hypothetical protein
LGRKGSGSVTAKRGSAYFRKLADRAKNLTRREANHAHAQS